MLIAAFAVTLINVGSPRAEAVSAKINLTADMVKSEMNPVLGDITKIVDEQTAAGDPKEGTGTRFLTSQWHAGWSTAATGATAYLDLGQEYVLTDIYLNDGTSGGDLVVSAGTPGNWTPLFTDSLPGYQQWLPHAVNVTTRYVQFKRLTTDSNFHEVVLYGTPATADIQPPAASTLIAGSATATTIPISWTAPGDNGNSGTATEYDIRYSTTGEINTGNWGTASPANGEPAPSIAGSSESYTLTGLSPNTTYYIAMKTLDEANNESPLSNVLTVTTPAAGAPGQIVLRADMIYNERGSNSGATIADDQLVETPNFVPNDKKRWSIGSKNLYLTDPLTSLVIDLGSEYALTEIKIHDGQGESPVTVSTGIPGAWNQQFTDQMTLYNKWSNHTVSVTTRYVQIAVENVNNESAWINEVKIFGSLVGAPPAPVPTPIAHELPTMNKFIGVNSFVDVPQSVNNAVNFIREYHNWYWDEGDEWPFGTINGKGYSVYPNNQNKFAPSWAGGGGWNFDQYYEDKKDDGVFIFPNIKASVAWLTTGEKHKPVSPGEDRLSPATYMEHADHMFQYAARYGSIAVADNKLKLAAGQPRLSGLDTLQYYENWNEPDNHWNTRAEHFTPYEYAAMSSADYDGHLGTLGNTVGIKNADPNAKMVMGGLGSPNLEYIRALKLWSDINRGGDFPFDVINIHDYNNNGTDQSNGTVGISPEAANMKGKLKKIVDYRDQFLPGKEVWLTEFGYDTKNSPQKAGTISGQSVEQVQANWIIRSYLAAAAAGIDRAAMYMIRDVYIEPGKGSPGKFDSSGLVRTKEENYSPKLSWYYVYTFKNTLNDMRYIGEQVSNNPKVMIYKFKSATSNAGAYVVWNMTSDNSLVNGYSLALQGNPTSASQVEMVANDTDGVTTALTISGDKKVTVNVSEKPLFVLVNNIQ